MRQDKTVGALRLRVGVAVAVGALCLTWAVADLDLGIGILYPVVIAGLMAIADFSEVRWLARTQHVITPVSAALLVGVALLPWSWAVLAVAVGSSMASTARRQPLIKWTFNTSKEAAGATAAAAVFHALGDTPPALAVGVGTWAGFVLALAAAALAYAVVEKLLLTPVIAAASRTSWRRVLTRHAYLDASVRPINLLVAAVTVVLHAADPRMLAVTPLAVLAIYLTSRHRLYVREERRAWQELAEATAAVSRVGTDEVIPVAVAGAVALFQDLEIDVEHRYDSRARLVRADHRGVTYDGSVAAAPTHDGPELEYPLELDADSGEGELRLRFRVEPRLSDRERHMLTTFIAGLSTAIRNATAYAEVARLAQQNAYDATHDALTGLPNRRQLRERTEQALDARPRRGIVALVLLDLDHFKEVNDTLGHVAGDQVLVEVARRLGDAADDGFVARLGGDEFAVLYTGLGAPAVATHRARGLLAALREPMELDGVLIDLQNSAGLAVAGDHTDPDELLRRADVAMYQSKESGRQVAVYAHSRDSADLNRLALAGELPRAVQGREFTVGFQPIVDLASGQVIAAEALARWQHPDLGHLPPASFLSLVERSGLLAPFTEAVLRHALEAAAEWGAAGFDLQMAVNISPRSLADPKLPGMVLKTAQRTGVEPHQLVLELTESSAIGHVATVTRNVTALREAGVKIALDDFGTGQSSMAAVFQVPVDQLKVDRSWVAALDETAESHALICATVELARRLGQTVVAEGVERPTQRETLWELGCAAGQGSLFGWPPQPASAFLHLLQRGHEGTPGMLAAQLHPEATVVRLPRQPSRSNAGQS